MDQSAQSIASPELDDSVWESRFYLLKNQLIDDFVSGGVHKRPGRAGTVKRKLISSADRAARFLSVTKRPQGFSLLASSKKAPVSASESTALE